jgi:hypothetical protein
MRLRVSGVESYDLGCFITFDYALTYGY